MTNRSLQHVSTDCGAESKHECWHADDEHDEAEAQFLWQTKLPN